MRLVGFLLLAWTGIAGAQGARPTGFPHEKHARLFPLCENCHAGIPTGNASTSMPDEGLCRACHNGTDVRAVEWSRPAHRQGLLRFSHNAHARETDSTGRACATCHGNTGSPRMSVRRAEPAKCLTCHTHSASSHLADDNRCATCHVTLAAASDLTSERIAALPKPTSHQAAGFAYAHAPATQLASASCATCHARESCARCHVNASSQPLIASLAPDVRVAALVAGRAASYPVPEDHKSDMFDRGHGGIARASTSRCAACHTRASCTTCHVGSGASDVLERMPVPAAGGAQGVRLRLQPIRLRATTPALAAHPDTTPKPVFVHNANIRTTHGAQASTGALTCEGCHTRQFCADCHTTEQPRRFHGANFVQRHSSDAWGRETSCATCHNTELFCRSCHKNSGLASQGRLNVAYHDAQPLWLLQHGRAARQGLESCTTCHAQRDCLTCHSTLGWGVSPHGPGFRAERQASKNATQCLMCHLRIPGRP